MTACVVNKYIYVSDHDIATVYEAQLTANNTNSQWSVGVGSRGLSENPACNLLVAGYYDNKIREYTTSGSLVREICLKSTGGKLLKPLHVI
jgi:hypothetical protein